MPAPFEIVAHPLTVYLAAVGTAFPATNATPSASWTKLGTSGDKNYDEEGVTVTHQQTIATFRPAGSTAERKAWRTEEGLLIAFTLVDVSPEQYAKVLNDIAVTTTVGPPATKDFNLLRGVDVARFALLARGKSPVLETVNAQYQVPIVIQNGEPAPVYRKGEPAGLQVEFKALEDDTTGFGKLMVQTA